MRITTLKLLLSAIAASVVTMLAAGPAAATVGSCDAPVFLHLNTPGTVLSETAPGAGTGTFVELPALRRSGGNPYLLFGEWDGSFESHAACSDVYDLQLWLGLRNSDDQGTNFDVKVELFVDGISKGTKEVLCIKGLTRNPVSAAQISPSDFASFSEDGPVDVALKVSARIGTGGSCGGHASATGLRLYYGSQARDSRFVIGQAVAASTACPATGCTLDAADGSTSVDVDVPGGGNAGTLTIVLSTPPTDDGCPLGEGGGPVIGSEVTVVPPGGYTAGNPITVDITYTGVVTVTAVCKSNNGNLPFTALPSCTFFDDSSTPTNVPCWVSEASNEVLVYMTSQDPSFTAH
jgi:hypothetical protein